MTEAASFAPPGPGQWQLDRSHITGGATPIIQWLLSDASQTAYVKLWRLMGIPAETLSMCWVNGFMYTRVRPLVAPDRVSSRPPPAIAIKVLSRLHPEFRRREKAASRTLAASPAPAVIAEWHSSIRPALVARNLAYEDVDLADLDDASLSRHLEELLAYTREAYEEHFRLHGYDLGPIALLILEAKEWGLSGAEVVPALAGASPSTLEPVHALAEIRRGVEAAGVTPHSLDDVAGASAEVAAQLQDYLRHHGSVIYAGYDLDCHTLGEAPDVILATIMSASSDIHFDHNAHDKLVNALRNRVPPDARDRFDELLHDARAAMDLRDDNGPVTAEWPTGLLRLAMLEAGRRLHTSGRLREASHVFELDRHELPRMMATHRGPSADALAARAIERARAKTFDAPRVLGDPEIPPPLDALPTSLARTVLLVQTAIDELGMANHPPESSTDRLSGVGVGAAKIVGRARVAETAEAAFEVLEPGDILVTRTTSPTYNMVLPLVGGLVTAEGGPMSHAAVLSRELGIPAIVGAPDAMDAIVDGATVEIDPQAGRVRVLAT